MPGSSDSDAEEWEAAGELHFGEMAAEEAAAEVKKESPRSIWQVWLDKDDRWRDYEEFKRALVGVEEESRLNGLVREIILDANHQWITGTKALEMCKEKLHEMGDAPSFSAIFMAEVMEELIAGAGGIREGPGWDKQEADEAEALAAADEFRDNKRTVELERRIRSTQKVGRRPRSQRTRRARRAAARQLSVSKRLAEPRGGDAPVSSHRLTTMPKARQRRARAGARRSRARRSRARTRATRRRRNRTKNSKR